MVPTESAAAPVEDEPAAKPSGLKARLARWGPMLWWLHSIYALGLGIGVLMFASKGFGHARWLAISLGSMWIILLVFFRWFGGRNKAPEHRHEKIRFYVMTYMLKNLYQGMLFFLLPFYWRSAVYGAPSQWFVVVLGACALLSTLDVVFDQVLMRFKIAASVFYFLTLFCCLNLVIPALFPNTRSLVTLVAAAVGVLDDAHPPPFSWAAGRRRVVGDLVGGILGGRLFRSDLRAAGRDARRVRRGRSGAPR